MRLSQIGSGAAEQRRNLTKVSHQLSGRQVRGVHVMSTVEESQGRGDAKQHWREESVREGAQVNLLDDGSCRPPC